MSLTGRWHDANYAIQQTAYRDGEYDGYWQRPPRTGTHDNLVWVYYLRGYLAGVKDRESEPPDEMIDRWMRDLAAQLEGGER